MTEKVMESPDSAPEVVTLRMSYSFMVNYNYLVVDPTTRRAVIVDPAWQMEKLELALKTARAVLSGILLTHSHPDHVHLAKPVARTYRCPIWMSEQEIDSSGFYDPRLVAIDETVFSVGHTDIQPMLTPGHTPGCMCYLVADNLFTGDVLFAEGCGFCTDVSAAYAMYDSLEKLKSCIGPQTRIFPGHSYGKAPGQLFGRVMKDNMYLQFPSKESFARFRLRNRRDKSTMLDFA